MSESAAEDRIIFVTCSIRTRQHLHGCFRQMFGSFHERRMHSNVCLFCYLTASDEIVI